MRVIRLIQEWLIGGGSAGWSSTASLMPARLARMLFAMLACLAPLGSCSRPTVDTDGEPRIPTHANGGENIVGSPWSFDGSEPVASTAGAFSSSYQVKEILGAGGAAGHWLCPGVGFARHEHVFCGTTYGIYTVFDLIDYTIPPLVAVE